MTLLRYVAIALGAGLLAGCSSSRGTNQETTDLQDIMHLLHTAASTTGQPPDGLADLEPFQTKWPEAYNSVKSGDFVVLWGTPINWGKPGKMKEDVDVAAPEMVLAYGKDVPTEGGFVLTSAGKITRMSAAEFASVPRMKK
jgi:hypothetical protein